MVAMSKRGFTLVEVLVAISLIMLVLLAGGSIDIVGGRALALSRRRARVQDEAMLAMDHMVRNIRLANWIDPTSGTGFAQVMVDDDNSPANLADDTTITYNLSVNQILFSDSDAGITDEVIAKDITNLDFDIVNQPVQPVFLTIDITAAHDPSTYDPSSVDPNNPGATLHAGVTMRCRARD